MPGAPEGDRAAMRRSRRPHPFAEHRRPNRVRVPPAGADERGQKAGADEGQPHRNWYQSGSLGAPQSPSSKPEERSTREARANSMLAGLPRMVTRWRARVIAV